MGLGLLVEEQGLTRNDTKHNANKENMFFRGRNERVVKGGTGERDGNEISEKKGRNGMEAAECVCEKVELKEGSSDRVRRGKEYEK